METYTQDEKGVLIRWHQLLIEENKEISGEPHARAKKTRDALSLLEHENESLIIRYVNKHPRLIDCVWSISKTKFNLQIS
jgi:hypothetical protein